MPLGLFSVRLAALLLAALPPPPGLHSPLALPPLPAFSPALALPPLASLSTSFDHPGRMRPLPCTRVSQLP